MALFAFLNNPMEWAIVALIAFLFFGNRLPGVMRSLGQGVTEFKKGLEGVPEDDDADRPRKADKAVTHEEPAAKPIVSSEASAVKEPATEKQA